jgi:2-C-methyl-D-erythritol 4-phosphate cytidylyltransferase/2-C-methyl-D-erythritol 2,4-cyclodiphosphate synthase
MSLHGVVVGAGSGLRFGTPKAMLGLGDRMLWEWARDCLLAAGASSVVLVGDMPGGVPGGRRRRDSVAAGLAALPPDARHVLIHDAARPLASGDLARAVVERLGRGDVAGVVPAVPVRDTLKRVEGEDVRDTVDRSMLVAVQTPQGFVLEELLAAHAADDEDASDDAAMIERRGGRVVTIPGEPANLKITYPEDLAVARALLP